MKSLEETEALLYGGHSTSSGVVHNQRVFEFYEPGTRLESGIEKEST